ncbi:MAG TPA: hypothetical protein VGR81_04020 [Candidatus Acidoferrales bacterium]|nr:hypothetical protein [Candidatus Acidoferrales bacterium]
MWQKLFEQIDLRRARIIGVSLEKAGLSSQYLGLVDLTRTGTMLLPDVDSIVSYRFRYTPQTILIDAGGRVDGVWSGVLKSEQIGQIEQAVLSSKPVGLDQNKSTGR